ncbi:MAG: DUF1588 domain-containing protein [Myxococcota bacterium]
MSCASCRVLGHGVAIAVAIGSSGCYVGLNEHDASPDGAGVGGSGDVEDPEGEGPGVESECEGVPRMSRVVRGLNGRQYARTVAAAFPGISAVDQLFRDSDRSAEFSTHSQIRRLDFKNTADVIEAAETVSAEAVGVVRQRFVCLDAAPVDDACVQDTIDTLTEELYRGPVPADHRQGLVALFDQARAATDVDRAIQTVVQAMLTSPRFLFRQELGEPLDDGTGAELSSFEVASALSYTLTDGPPDAPLWAAAQEDALRSPEQIEAHARRLLAMQGDEPSGMVAFVREMAGLQDFALISKDPEAFPAFDETTRDAVLADFEATVGSLLGSDEPTLERLLLSRQFVVSPPTAQLLGWDDPQQYDPDAGLVEIDEVGRQGLLTHPALLGTYAHESENNPVARGHFVSDTLLCIAVPPPPDDVSFPDLEEVQGNETLRQTLERVHSVGTCAGCHSVMDPYGWPFEVFDAVGRRRDTDNGLPIDDSSTILVPDEFEGPVQDVSEMLDIIAGSSIAHVCVSQEIFKYVVGVGDEQEGYSCITEELATPFVEDGDVPSQFVRLLTSPWFLERSIEP